MARNCASWSCSMTTDGHCEQCDGLRPNDKLRNLYIGAKAITSPTPARLTDETSVTEAIELAARRIFACAISPWYSTAWEDEDEDVKAHYRDLAEAAFASRPVPSDEPVAARTIEAMWQEHIERDDRNSPEEYPEMALITFEEFERYVHEGATHPDEGEVRRKLEEMRERCAKEADYVAQRAGIAMQGGCEGNTRLRAVEEIALGLAYDIRALPLEPST